MLIAAIVLGLAATAWLVLFRRGRFAPVAVVARPRESRACGTLETVHFPAIDGTPLEGWLLRPHAGGAPLVIMAPGLGGTKEGLLEPFAWRFVERDMAVLMFDYRCFGGSGGAPRHWVDPARHRQDYEAALAFARAGLAADGHVDPTRIGLWGSSFSGGTAIVTAAGDAGVQALIAQCPYLETPPALEPKGLALARFVVWATLDLLRVLPPIYVPLYGRPGEWVFAASRENPSAADFDGGLDTRHHEARREPHPAAAFWSALPAPLRGGWQNRMLARGLASLDQFAPMAAVPRLACPTLLVGARHDDMVPLAYVERAHALLPMAAKQLRVYDCGHFDLYLGEVWAENAAVQAEFFAAHLHADRAGHAGERLNVSVQTLGLVS